MSRILYGVPIDKYFALNLEGIKPINDAVGGVTLTALYDIPNAGITKGKEVTLKGDMAEAYVRSRDMDRATAAYERGERQMQYVKAFANQVLGAVKSDFNVVTDLNVEQQIERPQLQITPKRELLARYGITLPEFAKAVSVLLAGEPVATVYENNEAFDLTLKVDDTKRATTADIGQRA